MKSAKTVILILFFSIIAFQNNGFAKVEAILGNIKIQDNPNLAALLPISDESEVILSRSQYVISYNRTRRTPNWVAWKLESNQIGNTGRTNQFEVDADLEKYLTTVSSTEHAVKSIDYNGSCFDRGHQIPSADRSDILTNNQATFLMSNMIPQTPFLNRVIWEHLEQHTRDLVQKQNKKAYIIAGPIYDEDFGAIGPQSNIKIPSKDFKVIVLLDANQTPKDINPNTPMIAVIMPNTLENGDRPIANTPGCVGFKETATGDINDWKKYQTTLNEVEKQSRLTLFPH